MCMAWLACGGLCAEHRGWNAGVTLPTWLLCLEVPIADCCCACCPTDELPDHPGTRMLALGGSPLVVDGPLLLGLLRGYPTVGTNW